MWSHGRAALPWRLWLLRCESWLFRSCRRRCDLKINLGPVHGRLDLVWFFQICWGYRILYTRLWRVWFGEALGGGLPSSLDKATGLLLQSCQSGRLTVFCLFSWLVFWHGQDVLGLHHWHLRGIPAKIAWTPTRFLIVELSWWLILLQLLLLFNLSGRWRGLSQSARRWIALCVLLLRLLHLLNLGRLYLYFLL